MGKYLILKPAVAALLLLLVLSVRSDDVPSSVELSGTLEILMRDRAGTSFCWITLNGACKYGEDYDAVTFDTSQRHKKQSLCYDGGYSCNSKSICWNSRFEVDSAAINLTLINERPDLFFPLMNDKSFGCLSLTEQQGRTVDRIVKETTTFRIASESTPSHLAADHYTLQCTLKQVDNDLHDFHLEYYGDDEGVAGKQATPTEAPICNPQCPSIRSYFTVPQFKGLLMPYYRSPNMNDLYSVHLQTKVGIIAIHALGRDAQLAYCETEESVRRYFSNMDSVYIIAPKFELITDSESDEILYWTSNNGWRAGDLSSGDLTTRVSSYEVLDIIVRTFANRGYFPVLEQIIIIGHSAGGQAVQRYALGNLVDGDVTVPIRYVVANPSTYAYLTPDRVQNQRIDPDCALACNASTILSDTYTFALPSARDRKNCPDYNTYRYGLLNLNKYMATSGEAMIVYNYWKRDVVYLFGDQDVCSPFCNCALTQLDQGCEAMMQGYCRFQRGWTFYHYLQHVYAGRASGQLVHRAMTVRGSGHDGCKMLIDGGAQEAMFGRNK